MVVFLCWNVALQRLQINTPGMNCTMFNLVILYRSTSNPSLHCESITSLSSWKWKWKRNDGSTIQRAITTKMTGTAAKVWP